MNEKRIFEKKKKKKKKGTWRHMNIKAQLYRRNELHNGRNHHLLLLETAHPTSLRCATALTVDKQEEEEVNSANKLPFRLLH